MPTDESSDSSRQSVWPGIRNQGGTLDHASAKDVEHLIDEFSWLVAEELQKAGVPRFAFPLFRPFNGVFAVTNESLLCVIAPLAGGLATIRFMDWTNTWIEGIAAAREAVERELGWENLSSFTLPKHLLSQPPDQRANDLRGIAANAAERLRDQLRKQSRSVQLRPIFRTPLQEIEVDESLCFVLMPFAAAFDRLYRDVVVPAIQEAGLTPLRADEVFSPTPIVEDVWRHIASARLIVADVTQKNPNVFYELGIAHTIGKPVIVLTQSSSDVPFDIAYLRYFSYRDDEQGWRLLRNDLSAALKAALRAASSQKTRT